MSLFASFAVVALLQLLCIVASFFLPEFLYRTSGAERPWHVPAAAALLLATVLTLSWLHGAAIQSEAPLQQAMPTAASPAADTPPAPKPETVREPEIDFAVTTRFGTVPLHVGAVSPLELSIANNGAQAIFACELRVLDAQTKAPAPQDAVLVKTVQNTVQADPGATAACSWEATPRIPGSYVLQASAASAGTTHTQEITVQVEHDYRVNVDDAIWVFNSRTQASAEKLAQRLRDAGFHNAAAKGEWKTRSEEQYIFYRDEDKTNLTELFEEVGVTDVQPFYWDSPRVGSKVKEMFEQNPKLGFLVIIH